MHRYRSHTCGALREADIGQEVRLSGWCHRIRDHGGLLFIDLRDHYGMTQCVVDPDSKAFGLAEKLRAEWVVKIDGKVRRRPEGTDNPELPTGTVEIFINEIEVLGEAGELPMPVFGDQEYPEEIRLKYRFLDLRREKLHQNIATRGAIVDLMRARMKRPVSLNSRHRSSPRRRRKARAISSCPRAFIPASSTRCRRPAAVQAIADDVGFDRYFQIAPCFRDEDPRADRLPGEFYQLDLEMSLRHAGRRVRRDGAGHYRRVRGVANGKPVTKNWPRIPFAESLRKYGTDKPDLRNPLVMQDVSEHFRGSG